jgi:glucose uptake protein
MILPHTYFAVLLLMIVSGLCWGSWAGALKMAKGWRFELFAFDMAFGMMAACLLYALVFGNTGYDGFNLVDDAMHAGKQQWAWGMVGGVAFALSNLFLLASVSTGGLAVGLTVAFGTAAIVQGCVYHFGAHTGHGAALLGGVVLVVAAAIAATVVQARLARQRHEALAKAGKAKSTRRPSGFKPIALALASGALMQAWRPLIQKGMATEIGLGPYAMPLFLGLGALGGTLAFGIFFVFLPVEGEALDISSIARGTLKQHMLGWLGGAVLATAVVARLVGVFANAEPGVSGGLPAGATTVSPNLGFLLAYGAPVAASVLGFLAWRELRDDARGMAHWMAAAMSILFLCGLALISLAAAAPLVP